MTYLVALHFADRTKTLTDRAKQACTQPDEAGRAGCVEPTEVARSARVLDAAIAAIKEGDVWLRMRVNPKFRGVDEVPTSEEEASEPHATEPISAPCQVVFCGGRSEWW